MPKFEAITEKDIVQIKGPKTWLYDGRELTEGEISNLKSEAEIIENTKLWQLMIKESRYHAQKKGMIDAGSYQELESARALLNLTIFFEKFIKNIKK